jgi:peptidylprolyl isomerase
MYMCIQRIVLSDIMKKSEKVKGKEAATARRKSFTTYGIILVIGVILVAAAGYFVFANRTVAKAGDTVGVYYTGKLDNGTEFDSNMNKTPLEFTLGSGQMISGFDEAVTGMAVGEEKTVTLPVDKAYGPYQPDLVVTVNRSANLSITNPYVGERLTVTNPSTGATSTVKITNITPSTITVDANFDLAGQNLTFTIKLATIGKA